MLQEWFESSLGVVKSVGSYLVNASKDIALPIISKVTNETAEKIKDIYKNNKEIVISVSVATVVYLIMRPKKLKNEAKEPEWNKKAAKKSVIRSFISEHS